MWRKNYLHLFGLITLYIPNIVSNEERRELKCTQVTNIQTLINRNNTGETTILTNIGNIAECLILMIEKGPFTCMEYNNQQKICRNNNGEETLKSLMGNTNTGWSFYAVEYVGNSTEAFKQATEECKLDALGREYRGKTNTTVNGIQCQPWSGPNLIHAPLQQAIDVLTDEEPSVLTTNYCRNPDGELGGPWCYTTDPNDRWNYCGVPYCSCYT